jgi:hypothetical protein
LELVESLWNLWSLGNLESLCSLGHETSSKAFTLKAIFILFYFYFFGHIVYFMFAIQASLLVNKNHYIQRATTSKV